MSRYRIPVQTEEEAKKQVQARRTLRRIISFQPASNKSDQIVPAGVVWRIKSIFTLSLAGQDYKFRRVFVQILREGGTIAYASGPIFNRGIVPSGGGVNVYLTFSPSVDSFTVEDENEYIYGTISLPDLDLYANDVIHVELFNAGASDAIQITSIIEEIALESY